MRDAKRLYYQSLFHDNKNNSRKTWDTLNEIINKKQKSNLTLPSKFLDNQGNVYDGDNIADGFNNFFSTIGSNLEKNIPAPNNSPLEYLRNITYEPFDAQLSTSCTQVVNIIKSLNPVGGGLDKISTKILLLTYEKCISHLTYFFNLCLRTAVFPDLLKIAVVVPIFKSGEKNKFNNYRPISLLPVFSKILEKIIHSYLLNYLNDNNILNPFQFGFRKKHSTYMPLAHLVDEITKALQNHEITCGIFLDLQKAFDTVSLDILLKKLDFIGIKGDLYKILESYLNKRLQRTKYNDLLSVEKEISIGVPQGSILGPLLFIIYINDLCNICNDAKFYFFADDTAVIIKSCDVRQLQEKIDILMPKITEWFKSNRLSLNINKTNYQIYSPHSISNIEIILNGSKIARKKQIKYLGVVMEEDLKFNQHISNISSIISRNIGIMGRAKTFLSSRELVILYNSLVLPYLNYCAVVWGSNYPSRLEKLLKLQKRAIRVIDNKPYLYPTNNLFVKYKVLKFHDIVKIQNILIMLGYLNESLPISISNMFDRHVSVNTRAVKHFHVPYAPTNYRSFSISYTAPDVWNRIICQMYNDIESVPRNKHTLKKHVKKYLISQYNT